jgi:hypothetical protein
MIPSLAVQTEMEIAQLEMVEVEERNQEDRPLLRLFSVLA